MVLRYHLDQLMVKHHGYIKQGYQDNASHWSNNDWQSLDYCFFFFNSCNGASQHFAMSQENLIHGLFLGN